MIEKKGVQVRPLWYPCDKQIYLRKYEKFNLVNSEKLYKKVICLPSSFFLNKKDISKIARIVKNVIEKKPHKTIIIAEIGVNHNGNFDTAKKLIKIAKEIGADYAKFQMYEPDEMIIETAKKAEYQNLSFGKSISQKDMLRKFYLSELKLIKLHKYCKKIGIKFLASVFDEISLQRYIKLKPDYIKLPSPEINNLFLLKKIKSIKNKIPIIFSTGMSTNKEILNVYKILGKRKN